MFKIRKDQYLMFREDKINRFVLDQMSNLRAIQGDAVRGIDEVNLAGTIRYIHDWSVAHGIEKLENIEYMINLFFLYRLTGDRLKNDRELIEIVDYPDRIEDNKLFLIHQFLKFNIKQGD